MICLFASIAKADEPYWVRHITSKDSTVWIRLNIPDVIYKIIFNDSGKIYWEEEKDSASIVNLMNEYKNLEYEYDMYFDKKNNRLWHLKYGAVYVQENNDWKEVFFIPYSLLSQLHVRENGEVWAGGLCYVGYYRDGAFTRIFFIDDFQDTNIILCAEDDVCHEEEEPQREDFDTEEDYREAHTGWEIGDSRLVCFCDGRKTGYIQSAIGYVNFSANPNDPCAPPLGIILDNVRIFYWENENSNWWKVEINEAEGYVHKSGIKPEQNEEFK
jgi:hypothetical protein